MYINCNRTEWKESGWPTNRFLIVARDACRVPVETEWQTLSRLTFKILNNYCIPTPNFTFSDFIRNPQTAYAKFDFETYDAVVERTLCTTTNNNTTRFYGKVFTTPGTRKERNFRCSYFYRRKKKRRNQITFDFVKCVYVEIIGCWRFYRYGGISSLRIGV